MNVAFFEKLSLMEEPFLTHKPYIGFDYDWLERIQNGHNVLHLKISQDRRGK